MKIDEATGFINPARVRIALGEKNALDLVEFGESKINARVGDLGTKVWLKTGHLLFVSIPSETITS